MVAVAASVPGLSRTAGGRLTPVDEPGQDRPATPTVVRPCAACRMAHRAAAGKDFGGLHVACPAFCPNRPRKTPRRRRGRHEICRGRRNHAPICGKSSARVTKRDEMSGVGIRHASLRPNTAYRLRATLS